VIGICKGGARELGPYGITVNVLAPGAVDTEIMGGRLQRSARSRCRPASRWAGWGSRRRTPLAFPLSEGAGYINGATIQLDGGKHMH
jgi:NAD(P)-dependent dehydrogenase (short-subunit alcohol dehydrogenase family)